MPTLLIVEMEELHRDFLKKLPAVAAGLMSTSIWFCGRNVHTVIS